MLSLRKFQKFTKNAKFEVKHSPLDTSGTEVCGSGIFGSGISGNGSGFLVFGDSGPGIFRPGLGFPEHLFFPRCLRPCLWRPCFLGFI